MINIQAAKGFTLIEVLVAVAVLAIGIVGVLAMFPMATQVVKSAQMASIAVQISQEKIEEKISRPYGEIVIRATTEDYGQIANFRAFKRVTKITCFDPNVAGLLPNCPGETGAKRIEITVFWKSPLGITEKSINTISLISKR